MRLAGANVLVVPPFECAWLTGEEARFAEPGKACLAFEAMTENDITVVFKESAGSKHYSADSGSSYTFILGSHRNRRLKIKVDGETVADVASAMLQPTHFDHYWINILDGVVTVGKGDPGCGVVTQWVDSKPNRSIRCVGLSSWDKHVVYRNIQVLPPIQVAKTLAPSRHEGFGQYVESQEFADLQFVVAPGEKTVPAHKILLAASCSKFEDLCPSSAGVVLLPWVKYHTLRAILRYIYTGHTQVDASDVRDVRELAEKLGLVGLVSDCDKVKSVAGKDLCNFWASAAEPREVEVGQSENGSEKPEPTGAFFSQLPVDVYKLGKLLDSSEYTDVELYVEGDDEAIQAIRAHKLILSAWSAPFAKMFTNGMRESKMDEICIGDAGFEPLLAMLSFMYKGHLALDAMGNSGSILLPLLILADRFGLQLLQQKCITYAMDSLSEDSACAVLQVAETMPGCQELCERCVDICAKHFEFCTASPAHEFQQLHASSLQKILQHPDLRVSSEEKVLDAVFLWVAKTDEIKTWQDASACLESQMSRNIFSDWLPDLGILLPTVRFPVMSRTLLWQLEGSYLSRMIQLLYDLVVEALDYTDGGSPFVPSTSDVLQEFDSVHWLVTVPKCTMKFSPRPATFKELQYICDGDCNGVFYHIGTSYGLHSWMNPVLTKRMVVTASSPAARFTDGKALVSRNYQQTSFSGPCSTNGQISSWWKVDLGQSHQLVCNYYTVRQDGSNNFMRSWSLQGSSDDHKWRELCTHMNVQTVCKPGQYASWPVHGAPGNLPYRYFRIILTGPTSSITNPWNFCLCYLELYGYFQ